MKYQAIITVSHEEFFEALSEDTGVDAWELYQLFQRNNSQIEHCRWCVDGDAVSYFKEAMGSAYDIHLCEAAAAIVETVRKASGEQTIWFEG